MAPRDVRCVMYDVVLCLWFQVAIDSLRQEHLEIQQRRAEDAEKHHREQKNLQDRYDALAKFAEVGKHVVTALAAI